MDNKNSGKLGCAAAAAKFSHQREGTLKFWESHGLDVPVSHAPHFPLEFVVAPPHVARCLPALLSCESFRLQISEHTSPASATDLHL